MKNRNDYILGITKCNSFAMQYFNMDIMDIIEVHACTYCTYTVAVQVPTALFSVLTVHGL